MSFNIALKREVPFFCIILPYIRISIKLQTETRILHKTATGSDLVLGQMAKILTRTVHPIEKYYENTMASPCAAGMGQRLPGARLQLQLRDH